MPSVIKHPWYKQRWLLFLISIPIASVILSSIMIYQAVSGRDSLVSDNYYKDGLEINQTIEQDRLAQKMNISGIIGIRSDGHVELTLQSLLANPEPFVTLKLVHPTLGDRDVSVTLFQSGSIYTGEAPENLTGRWYIDLYAHDSSWRIRKATTLPTERFELKP